MIRPVFASDVEFDDVVDAQVGSLVARALEVKVDADADVGNGKVEMSLV